jgi:hypothetical protein
MGDNSRKIPLGQSLNQFTDKKISTALGRLGQGLPAEVVSVDETGTIVTIKFLVTSDFNLPQVTVPLITTEYVRAPVGAGTRGFVVPAVTQLASASGLTGGQANLAQPANLTGLAFAPLGNAGATVSPNLSYLVLYGRTGVQILDKVSSPDTIVTINQFGATVQLGTGGSVTVNGAGGVVVTAGGDVVAGLISLLHHVHTVGGGVTGPPQPP